MSKDIIIGDTIEFGGDCLEWRKKKPVYEYNELQDDIVTILSKIHGIDDIDRFLNPSINELGDYRTLKNIIKARDRIDKAINEDEKISIYADIDPDGIFAATTMFSYLKNLTNDVNIFHSQRSAGHGIYFGRDSIPNETKLLIIVDSSSNDFEICEQIQSTGIDIIILDHHQISKTNNHCILVNPQQIDCTYVNKDSCGTLITWQLCRALDDYYATSFADDYINFVAIATISDMMSMRSYENRYIVKEGLKRENIKNDGLLSLFQMTKVDMDNLSTTSIAFNISTCMNAVCRLDEIELAFKLLLSSNTFEAYGIAQKIIDRNELRKKQQAAFKMLLVPRVNHEDECIILVENTVGAGFKGLIAGDICGEYHKPTIVLSEQDGFLTGSYRSYNEYDLQSFLRQVTEIIYAEGHPQAGGCRMKTEDLYKVVQYFNENFEQSEEDQYIEYIMELDILDLNEPFIRDVEQFYKYNGRQFETGKFLINNILVTERKVIGKGNNTIKLETYSMSKSHFMDEDDLRKISSILSIMKFRTTEDSIDENIIGKEIMIVGELNINEYRDKKTNQCFLEDYRLVN